MNLFLKLFFILKNILTRITVIGNKKGMNCPLDVKRKYVERSRTVDYWMKSHNLWTFTELMFFFFQDT